MKTAAVLDALADTATGSVLENLLEQQRFAVERFRLPDLNIRPCRSCGSCGEQTPGLCVQKDDMESLYRSIGPCEMLVFLTPISFGGYSSHMKKAVDRLMAIGYPLYEIKKGHMLHPMRYTGKSMLVVGQAEDGATREEEAHFRLLVSRNSLNFQYPYRLAILYPEDDAKDALIKVLAEPEQAVSY